MTTRRTRRPTPAAVSRALAVIAQAGLTTVPNADLTTLREQAAAAPPVDSLDRDLAAMSGR
jgi:hypothetical protein